MFAALGSLVVTGCGNTNSGQQLGGIIRAMEHAKHATPRKDCKAQGRGESCVLTWQTEKVEITGSGPRQHAHTRLVVIR